MSSQPTTNEPDESLIIQHPMPTTPGYGLKTDTKITTPSHPSTYRLLYRGALSLPDSHLLLDGLTFFARLDSPSKHTKSYSLLENPLALALESMRGRPSLRFLGIVKLSDIYMDETGNVELDVYPKAALSRIYFENTFCLKPFSSSSPSQSRSLTSEIGVKVALGDSDGPETTQIIIYAQTKNSTTPSSENSSIPTVRLGVARITPPPQPQKRLPRPDDPIPRKPPVLLARGLQRAESSKGGLSFMLGPNRIGKGGDLKRVGSGSFASSNGNGIKRPKLVGGGSAMNDIFKVPEVPMRQGKGKEKEKAEDVFGDVGEVNHLKGKQKASTNDDDVDGVALEKANKADIKKAAMAYLAQTKDPTQKNVFIDKKHPEWKELWTFVYRGACFALRNRMKTEIIDTSLAQRVIKAHVKMYLTGQGPSEPSSSVASSTKGRPSSVTASLTGAGTTVDPIWIGR